MNHSFWLSDPSVIFRGDTWTSFVPMPDMSTAESLNAVLRFTVYASILLLIGTHNTSYLAAIPLVGVLSILLFKLFPNGRQIETFWNFGKKLIAKDTEKLTMPSYNNPFMNVLLTEIQDNPDRPDAADVSKKSVRADIKEKFKHTNDIYMDTDDAFDQANALRNFHTIQSSKVPNDQDAFLSWLAKDLEAPDNSSAFPARGGKRLSETHLSARGATTLPSTTNRPTGTAPSRS